MKQNLLSYIKNSICVKALVASVLVCAGTTFTHALPKDYYAANSKLDRGKWVKIKTTGEGIHQISYEQLREWGFANPSKVNVYGYASTLLATGEFSDSQPDDVVLSYTHHEGDNLYFYSAGAVSTTLESTTKLNVSTNFYSNDVYYLLSDRNVGSSEKIADVAYVDNEKVSTNHLSVNYVKENVQNPAGGGAYFLGPNIQKNGSVDLPFTVKNMDLGGIHSWNVASLRIGFAAYRLLSSTKLKVGLPENVTASLTDDSDEAPATAWGADNPPLFNLGSTLVGFNTNFEDGEYVFQAKHPNQTQTFMALDYAYFIYPRSNKMSGDAQLPMAFYNISNNENFSVEGPSTTRLLNVTNTNGIFGYETRYDNSTQTMTASFVFPPSVSSELTEKVVAFDVAKPQKEVEFVGEIENQNLHGAKTPDILIITTGDLLVAAEDLAQIHREMRGKDVLVVEHSKIFNEFSSATPEIMGYRRFVKMLYDRNPSKLKHVIMYGRSHWDNRCITSVKKDRLLIYETTDPVYSATITKNFGTDSYLGVIDDNYRSSNILRSEQLVAVGRIPAQDEGTGMGLNRKIKSYLEYNHTARQFNRSLVMCDDGDRSTHQIQAQSVANMLQNNRQAMTNVRAYNTLLQWENNDAKDLRRIATNAFKQGVGIFTYIGHGSNIAFGAEALWNTNYVEKTNYDKASFGVLATCFAFAIDNDGATIGGAMIEKPEGGMVAVIGAGREVYASLNSPFALAVAREYASADENTTFGEVWLRARNSLLTATSSNSDLCLNTLCYNLGGDPSLPVNAPQYSVEVTKLSVDDGAEIESLTTQTLEGQIVDKNGKVVSDFNGTVTVDIFDAIYPLDVIVRSDEYAGKINLEQDILLSKNFEVKNGKFSGTFTVPVPMHESEDDLNRMALYADSDDGRRADGELRSFKVVAGTDIPETELGEAPTIDSFTAIKTSEGIQSDVRFIASGTLSQIGLNTSDGIGSNSSLVIDGNTTIPDLPLKLRVNNSDNTWNVNLNVASLSAGNHTAALTIVDNAGRRASQTLSFSVGGHSELMLTADASTVRNNVTFDVENAGELVNAVLVIENRKGDQVYYKENVSFPCTVEMSKINDIADGHYKAYVRAGNIGGLTMSQPLPLVLVKKTE